MACSTEINSGGGNKEANVSSITKARLDINICAAKYNEDLGYSIETNITEYGRIKHFNSLVEIQYNWINLDALPEFIRNMTAMKLLDIIPDHLRKKLGIRKIPLSYVVYESVVPDYIGDISTTLS